MENTPSPLPAVEAGTSPRTRRAAPPPAGRPAGMNTADWAAAYRQHATSLRTWFVAAGVGWPVLLLANEVIWRDFAGSAHARRIGMTFLLAVGVQVLLALVDKYADLFGLYDASGRALSIGGAAAGGEPEWKRRFAHWWVGHDAPSMIGDIATLVLLGVGSFWLLDLLVDAGAARAVAMRSREAGAALDSLSRLAP